MKKCPVCKTDKPRSQYQKNRTTKDGLQWQCKPCRKVIDCRPEKRAQDRARYHRNTDGYRNQSYKRHYGITLADYNALLKKQNGACAICKKATGFKRKLAVDHDHQTGAIRGLLCGKCNPMIGYANDDQALLTAAIKYLRRHK